MTAAAIEEALNTLPPHVLKRSGSVFYSGPAAFEAPKSIYFLGLNPAGSPTAQALNTVERHIAAFRQKTGPWSEYLDESWEGAAPGTWGMQPRVLHMLQALGLDPQQTPASNVVFVRSANEKALEQEKKELLRTCWPVHQAVIDCLGVRTIVCFGKTAGEWVRQKVGANALINTWKEKNHRGWTSTAHLSEDNLAVVTLTHPSKAGWQNPLADPTPLVRKVLERLST